MRIASIGAALLALCAISSANGAISGYYTRPNGKHVYLTVGANSPNVNDYTAKFSTANRSLHSPNVPAIAVAGGGGLQSSDPATTAASEATPAATFKVEGKKVKEETSPGVWTECPYLDGQSPEEEEEEEQEP